MHASTSKWKRRFNAVATTRSAKDVFEASRSKGKEKKVEGSVRGTKVHSTNVFVTINTQQGPTEEDAAIDLIQKMIDFTEYITESAQGLDAITTWYDERGPKGFNVVDGSFEDEGLVRSVEIEFAVERGGRKNSIHSHIVFRIKHTGWLVFDRLKIKQECQTFMNLPKMPNVQTKLLGNPNEAQALRQYLLKGLIPKKIDK